MDKKITVKFGNVEYVWHNKGWSTPRNNLTVNTALAQKLTEFAIKNNLLTLEDVIAEKKQK